MIKYNKNTLIYIFLTAFIIQTSTVTAFSDTAYDVKVRKDESVYVTLDSMGRPMDIIVSDWLHGTMGKEKVIDKTILRNIKNINGYEKPDKQGQSLVWKPEGKDIFYQGQADSALPLRLYIKYYFNGKEVDPKSVAGRDGKLKIFLSIINNETHVINIKGIDKKIYTPFSAAVIINLPIDRFKNVKANAKIISDGSNQMITFLTFPGLNESFNAKKKLLNTQDILEISADVKKFELGSIMITATPELPDLSIIDSLKEADKLVAGINTLKDSSNQLAKGSVQIREGQKRLTLNISRLRDGIIQLDDGSKAFQNGISKLDDGLGLAYSGSQEIYEGSVDLVKNADKIGSGADIVGKASVEFAEESMDFAREAVNVMESISYIAKDNPDINKELKRSIARLKDKSIGLRVSAEKISMESTLLNKFLDSFKKVSEKLVSASKALVQGFGQLFSGSKELRKGSTILLKGTGELSSGLNQLEAGSIKLLEGSSKLSTNMDKFHREGMGTFKLSLNEGLEDLEEILIIKDEIMKLSKSYDTYTGLGENMTGSVKFIMKTDEIRQERTNKLKYSEAKKKDEGFFKWLIGKYFR